MIIIYIHILYNTMTKETMLLSTTTWYDMQPEKQLSNHIPSLIGNNQHCLSFDHEPTLGTPKKPFAMYRKHMDFYGSLDVA